MRSGDFSGAGVNRIIYDPLTRVYATDEQGLPELCRLNLFPAT
jgi:hypothetical protein